MTSTADLYAHLGLAPGADEQTIRHAFRRLAFELHPDRNPDPDAADAFRRVRAAYETLLDPEYQEAAEAWAVTEEIMRAAAEASRTRTRPVSEHASVCFALESGLRGLKPAVAGRVAVVLTVSAGLAGLLAAAVDLVFLLVAVVCGASAMSVWVTRRQQSLLHFYGNGFEDDRWPDAGRIGWGDVYALEADHAAGTLDLALSAPVAADLAELEVRPAGVLVWQGDRPFYRLPLGENLRPAVTAFEARTGLSAR